MARHRSHLGGGLLARDAFSQPREDGEPVVIPLGEAALLAAADEAVGVGRVEHRVRRERHPKLAVESDLRADEVFGRDADDREREAVKRYLTADRAGV